MTQLQPIVPPWCARCGDPLREGGDTLCSACHTGGPFALDEARAAFAFGGVVREAIHRFKYGGEQARAESLGLLLLPLATHGPWQPSRQGAGALPATTIAPVPLDAARRRARGYNQAEELARVLAGATGLPLETRLTRVRETRPQVGLDRQARRVNVRGAFAWHGEPLAGRRVLLVDDVMTTGATAEECAIALKSAGASWVGLVTVARPVGNSGSP